MKTPLLLIITLSLFVSSGCSNPQFEPAQNSTSETLFGEKTRPSCEVPEVDYQLKMQVVEFDVTSDQNLHFGFSLLPGAEWFQSFQAQFRLKKSTLTVSSSLSEFLKPLDPVAQETGRSQKKESFWGVELNLEHFQAGGTSQSLTPFFDVVRGAVTASLQKTSQILSSVSAPWNSLVVSKKNETEIIIPTGKLAGLKLGDQFEVYNVTHHWAGEPCKSAYRMATTSTSTPLAIFEIQNDKDLTPTAARLRLKQKLENIQIEQGAFVYAIGGNYKRSISLSELKPFLVTWQQGVGAPKELDLTELLKVALGPALSKTGFYLKSVSNQRDLITLTEEEHSP